jgi:ABC-type glycerol-3-phosphate transport system permease component/peptidoglycan/LPS O-acetylase OafA/YrhL
MADTVSKSDTRTSTRFTGADGIRAIACLAVILHHVAQKLDYYAQNDVVQNFQVFFMLGSSGVSIFFVLSGFLLSYPFWKGYFSGKEFPSIKEYVIKRAARILPGYYAALLISIILGLAFVPEINYFFTRLITGLTLTSGFHYVTLFPSDINSPLWSISFEVFSYVLMPLFMAVLFFFTGKNRSYIKAFLFWIGTIACIIVINGLIHKYLTPNNINRGWGDFGIIGGAKWWMPNYNPVGFFAHFAVGVVASGVTLYLYRPSERVRAFAARYGFDWCASALFIAILIFMWNMRNQEEFSFSLQHQPYFFPFLAMMVAALLVCLVHSRRMGRIVDNRFFRYTAKISFGLYIWHYVVFTVLSAVYARKFLFYFGIREWDKWLIISIILIVLSFIAATLSYHFLEKPFLEKAHRALTEKKPEMRYKRKIRLKPVLSVIALSILAIVFLYPLIWLFDASLRPALEIFQTPPVLFQKPIWESVLSYSRDSYISSFWYFNVGRALINSIVVTSLTIFLSGIVCSLCAYALTFIRFRGRTFFFMFAISTIMIPTSTLIISYYKLFGYLHLQNNWLGLILPATASGFGVFLLRQYFIKIPSAFIESAKMDGAGHLQIWWHLILPLSRPALAALAIIQFRLMWNDFLMPMIVMRDPKFFTLPLNMVFITESGPALAAGFITIIIPLALFMKFHRQFIENLTSGLKS